VVFVPLTVIALLSLPAATRADESDQPLSWLDPAPEYAPDMLCAGDCMVHWRPDDSYQEATPIPPRKPRWPPLFDLIRDLFKGD
jgi:hypothetical protein